jgi:hypothetical protein
MLQQANYALVSHNIYSNGRQVTPNLLEYPILCWPHISRTALQNNRDKLISSSYFKQAHDDIEMLHLSRSQKQFEALGVLMLQQWRIDKCDDLADWFEATYLTEPYNHWSVTSSGIPGVMPNQNPIESFHRDIKRDYYGAEGKHSCYDACIL